MMHDQSTGTLIPRMCALDNPALRQRNEAVGVGDHHSVRRPVHVPGANAFVGWMAHDFHADRVGLLGGLGKLTGVGAIDEQRVDLGGLGGRVSDGARGGIAVLKIGRDHAHRQHYPKVSTTRLRLRPLTCLPASQSRSVHPAASRGSMAHPAPPPSARSHAPRARAIAPAVDHASARTSPPHSNGETSCRHSAKAGNRAAASATRTRRNTSRLQDAPARHTGRMSPPARHLKEIGDQVPLRIGQTTGVALVGVVATMRIRLPIPTRCRARLRLETALAPEARDARLPQGFANRGFMSLDSRPCREFPGNL